MEIVADGLRDSDIELRKRKCKGGREQLARESGFAREKATSRPKKREVTTLGEKKGGWGWVAGSEGCKRRRIAPHHRGGKDRANAVEPGQGARRPRRGTPDEDHVIGGQRGPFRCCACFAPF